MIDDQPGEPEESDLPPPIEPATGPAADVAVQKLLRAKNDLKQRDSDAFWRGVLNDPVGRSEIWALLSSLNVFGYERHAAGPTGFPDGEATSYYRGQRDFGLSLYFRLQTIDGEAILAMHRDHDSRFAVSKPQPQRRRRKS
jgi:hypothetical protein